MIKNRSKWIKILNFWPPFLGAGIRVKKANSDFTDVEVEMKLRFWNRNYVGTHYGGSLYSMVDPFLMLMLMENLGKDYIVWDKAANIRFKKPGRGVVRARFQISREKIQEIRDLANHQEKVEPVFQVQVVDLEGTLIAEVDKVLHIRKRYPTTF